MITRLEAFNFRCLRRVAQPLGPLQVLIGPNASGKSSFADVLSFLGKFAADGLETAIVERAGSFEDLTWGRTGQPIEIAVEARVPDGCGVWTGEPPSRWMRYEVRLGFDPKTNKLGVMRERLLHRSEAFEPEPVSEQSLFLSETRHAERIFDRQHSDGVSFSPEVEGDRGDADHYRDASFRASVERSALDNLPDDEGSFSMSMWLRELLTKRIFGVSLDSRALHLASAPLTKIRHRPDGADLPWRVQELMRNPESFARWIEHLRTALNDLDGVRVVERLEDRFAYLMTKSRDGLEIPSWALSDGTLRLMALTLIAYLPAPGDIYFIKEPENGVHPGNLETIFQSLSSVYEGQVLLETHSPVLLGLAQPEQILCFSRSSAGTTIVRGDAHPALKEWRRDISIGTLFASGILG